MADKSTHGCQGGSFPPSGREPLVFRWRSRHLGMGLTISAAVLLASYLIPLEPDGSISREISFSIPCWFHQATGLPCPFCGMTRAFVNLAHLRVAQAFSFNPAACIIFGWLALYLTAGGLYLLTGWPRLRQLPTHLGMDFLLVVTLTGWVAQMVLGACSSA